MFRLNVNRNTPFLPIFFFEFYFSPNIFFGKRDKGKFDTSFYIVVETVLLIFSCNVLIYQPEQPGWPEARPSPARRAGHFSKPDEALARSGLPTNKARRGPGPAGLARDIGPTRPGPALSASLSIFREIVEFKIKMMQKT